MRIDFHMHSVHSDGELTPEELISMATENQIRALALTDHDTVSGLGKMKKLATEAGIQFLYGIEVSAIFPSGGLHILGYGFNPDDPKFLQNVRDMGNAREIRNQKIIKKLQNLGISISMEEVREKQGISEGTLGRPHIANTLVEKKAVGSFYEAFEKLLGDNCVAYVDKEIFTAPEVLDFIHRAGGKSFIAHPVSLNLDDPELKDYLATLKEEGLDGIEIYNSSMNPGKSEDYRKIAEDLNLFVSGGSDFHGLAKRKARMGMRSDNSPLDSSDISEELFANLYR